MKLLLTSAGLTNAALANELLRLADTEASHITLAFVPTAANALGDDKGWLIDNLMQFKKQQYACVDIVDPSATPIDSWLPRLKRAQVICFGGGDELYLYKKLHEVGLAKYMQELFEKRVYMGISAGSMIAARLLQGNSFCSVYPERSAQGENGMEGFGFVNVHIVPHYNSAYYPDKRKENLNKLKGSLAYPLYALDDQSALSVDNGTLAVVGAGESHIIN